MKRFRLYILNSTLFVAGSSLVIMLLITNFPIGVGQLNSTSSKISPVLLLNQSTMFTNGKIHIAGQLKNEGAETLNSVKVVASFYDEYNRFLGSEVSYANPTTINPNGGATFDISADISNGRGKIYTITLAWQNSEGTPGFSIMKPLSHKESVTSKTVPSNATESQSSEAVLTSQKPKNYPLKFTYLGTIGSEGSTSGKFFNPSSIEYSPSNNRIYVSDLNNDRIQIFDIKGRFLSTVGASGTGDGQFTHPGDVTIDNINGDIYISDIGNNRIQKFDSNGNFLTKWGTAGSGDGQFNHPGDIAIDARHSIYVTDIHNNRIQKFDSNGNFLTKWGTAGSGDGQFSGLTGITIGPDGYNYISDTGNDRIQKFDSDGQFIKKWSSSKFGHLNRPDGITYDKESGLIYVSDRKNARILVFNDDGQSFNQLDLTKSTHGLKIKPRDVAVDITGKLFVVDKANSKIHVFSTKPS